MERINFKIISQQSDDAIRQHTILEELNRCKEISITDCLANIDHGGREVLRVLENTRYNRRVKIQVLKNIWGEPVKPGDIVEWKMGRQTKDPFGKKYSQAKINHLIQIGELRSIEDWREAMVDEKGCIDVDFSEAMTLLTTRGVNYISNQPLTMYKETASGPTRHRKRMEGETWESYERNVPCKTQHFWLYAEAPSDVYEQLPDLPTVDKTEIVDVKKNYRRK